MRSVLRERFALLANPERAFGALHRTTLEHAVADHLKLLFLCALVATAIEFAWFVGRAAYLDLFYTADVNYPNMLNYALGQAGGYGLFYVVAGTLLLLAGSLALRVVVAMRYPRMLTLLLLSITPLLLFGWLPALTPSLALWSAFLFVVGRRTWGQQHG